MKIAFFTRCLHYGGAERQMVTLARGMATRGHEVVVFAFRPGGPGEEDLRSAGVRVRILAKRSRWDLAGAAAALVRAIDDEVPQVLHSYLGAPNLYAAFAKAVRPQLKLVWGLRAANLEHPAGDVLARLAERLEVWASGMPDLIIANAYAGKAHAAAQGFPEERIEVVSNGIDTERFRYTAHGRARLRTLWGVADSQPLIGIVGNLGPVKGHPTFLEAAARVSARHPAARFVIVGEGPEAQAERLREQARALGIEGRLIWAGKLTDTAAVYSALDWLCSASYGEGFSNVIAEAMACGLPCVVTDVGDSARIVERLGRVVPPRDASALAAAIVEALYGPRPSPAALRERIERAFGIPRLVVATEALIAPLLEPGVPSVVPLAP